MGKIIDMIKRARKKGDLSKKAFCAFLMPLGYSNMSIQPVQIRYKNFRKIKKKYSKTLAALDFEPSEEPSSNKVFICWLQGEENAPPIVKACISSARRYLADRELIIITAENYGEYTELPQFIVDKWKKGIISDTHFSDILRTELLVRHGGLWADATVYFTGALPEYVSGDLFLFRHYAHYIDEPVQYNNWFIYARPDNRVLKCVRALLFEYWRKHKKVKEYFLWHLFATLVFEKYPGDFSAVTYVLDDTALPLARNLTRPYDEIFWSAAVRISPIHKLNYKFEPVSGEEKTNLDVILERENLK